MTHDRFVVVPAAYVYLVRTSATGAPDEVLLQRRGPEVPYMAGHWAAAAAGHVEQGETADRAALREAEEELGLTAIDLEFLSTMQRTRGGEAIDERVDFFFTARHWDGEPEIQEPDKASELGWFRLDALPSPMVPHESYLLGLLASGQPVPTYLTHGF